MKALLSRFRLSPRRKAAVFTIVKNEPYFLRKYLTHYLKYFHNSDIYILDHDSNDGSTHNLPVNVVRVSNELAFDHAWLRQTVMSFQVRLLRRYRCVVFAEIDEMLYCTRMPLNLLIDEFLEDKLSDYITCRGYEVVQYGEELPLTATDTIFSKRKHWFANSASFDKTLISKVPLNWCNGFHKAFAPEVTNPSRSDIRARLHDNFSNKTTGEDYNVFMCHLHKFDLGLMIERHKARLVTQQKQDGGAPHNRSVDPEALARYIAIYNQVGSEVVPIPLDHLRCLRHL
jgi:hypothetical protein